MCRTKLTRDERIGGELCDAESGLSDLRELGTLHCVGMMARDLREMYFNIEELKYYLDKVKAESDNEARLAAWNVIEVQRVMGMKSLVLSIADQLRRHAERNAGWLWEVRREMLEEVERLQKAYEDMVVATLEAIMILKGTDRPRQLSASV